MSETQDRCEVCGALFDEEDLFCGNCGAEVPASEEHSIADARTATHNFDCDGCGASMSYDASAKALRCPFCGSVELTKKRDAKTLSPERVIPFRVARDQAVAVMRKWLGRGFWRPGDLAQRAAVVDMTAVYVPYWVFVATTHTHWTADTSRTPAGARADWFPLFGTHRGACNGLLVGASGVLSPAETWALCPFDLSAGRLPEEVDLDNVVVESFSVPRKFARPMARAGIEQLESEACRERYVPEKCRNMKVNVRIENLSSQPVLLPAWIMAYRYENRLFRFLVNGQSGRATGQAPSSWRKKLVAALLFVLALVVLLAIVGLASS